MESVSNLLKNDGEAYLIENFYDELKALKLMSLLQDEIPWQERIIKIFGRTILQPRLMLWMGDADCSYKYSGTKFNPQPWSDTLLNIKKDVEAYTNHEFNSALINLYRNENDSMGAHSDNEKELSLRPVIASISLGAARPFVFRHKSKKLKTKIMLRPGSLLIMSGSTQESWKHELPKLKKPTEPRINITFRLIKPH